MLFVMTTAITVAWAQAPAPITLQAAVESALAQHPSVAAAQQALVAALARLAQARAGRNLQLAVTGETAYGNADNIPVGGPSTTTTSVTVAASVELVNLQTHYLIKEAEAGVASAEAALVKARQDAALAAGQAYFAVLEAREVVAARETAVAQAEAQVREAAARVRAGVAARADALQAQASLAAAQVDLIAARNQVETTLAQLRAAIGRPLTGSIDVAPPPPPPAVPVSREQALAAAADRPEVVRARADIAAAQAALALAEVQARPLFSVGTSSSVDVLKDPKEVIWSVGATVTLSLLDGGQAQAAVAEARADLAAAVAREAQALQTAQVDALTAWVALQDALARVTATRASEAAASEALRAAEGRYQAGVGTIVEVLTARTAFQTASLSRIQAEFDVQTAALQVRHALGRPVIGGDR